jgi:hypothetical protein
VVANNSQQTWKYGRYLYILAITNKKITFRRTVGLWSETFIDRKVPINKLNMHSKAQQTIGSGKNTMHNQPGRIPNRSYETPEKKGQPNI